MPVVKMCSRDGGWIAKPSEVGSPLSIIRGRPVEVNPNSRAQTFIETLEVACNTTMYLVQEAGPTSFVLKEENSDVKFKVRPACRWKFFFCTDMSVCP